MRIFTKRAVDSYIKIIKKITTQSYSAELQNRRNKLEKKLLKHHQEAGQILCEKIKDNTIIPAVRIKLLDFLTDLKYQAEEGFIYNVLKEGLFSDRYFDFTGGIYDRSLMPVICNPLYNLNYVPKIIEKCLFDWKDPSVLPDLLNLFQAKPVKSIQSNLLNIICELTPPEESDIFVLMLDDEDDEIVRIAIKGIIKGMGDEAFPHIQNILNSRRESPDRYLLILDCIAELEYQKAVVFLYDTLKNGLFSDKYFNFAGGIYDRSLIPVICNPLYDLDYVPEIIEKCLLDWKDPLVLPDLLYLFWIKTEESMRTTLLNIICEITPSEESAVFLPMLDEKEHWILIMSLKGLAKRMGYMAFPHVRNFIKQEYANAYKKVDWYYEEDRNYAVEYSNHIQKQAIRLLGELKDSESQNEICEIITSTDDDSSKGECLKALSAINPFLVEPYIIEILEKKEGSEDLIKQAIELVVDLNVDKQKVFSLVLEFLKEFDRSDIAGFCLQTLCKLDKTKVKPVILEILEEKDGPEDLIKQAVELSFDFNIDPQKILQMVLDFVHSSHSHYSYFYDKVLLIYVKRLQSLDPKESKPALLKILSEAEILFNLTNSHEHWGMAFVSLIEMNSPKLPEEARKYLKRRELTVINFNEEHYSDSEEIVFNYMGERGTSDDCIYLIPFLASSYARIRELSANALARLGQAQWENQIKGNDEDFLRLAALGHEGALQYMLNQLHKEGQVRFEFARFFQRLLDINPATMHSNWSIIAILLNEPLIDKHVNYWSGSSDCTHDDYHDDRGIGLYFPKNPSANIKSKPADF